ncbi:MAG: hypothetical protein ACRD5L_06250, partial [Bryobacteraceae bacterium]
MGVLVVCLLCGLGAVAQDAPKADAYLGYSYLRSNYGNGISGYNQNGGVGQVAVYPSRWFGGVAEFSGFAVGNINSLPASGSMYTYLFGPRIRATHTGPLHPYVQALFGGAHISSDLQTTLGSTTRNGFAMALGGGLDLSVLPH